MEVCRRHDEVRRVGVERSRVGSAHLRFNRARRAEIEATQNAIETFGQTLLEIETKTEIERQLSRDAPVVLEEDSVIERLDRIVDRVIDLAGVAARTGGRNTEQERSESRPKTFRNVLEEFEAGAVNVPSKKNCPPL